MNNKWNSNFSWSKIPLPHNSAVCLFLIPYGFGMAVASGSVETCQLESIYQRMHVRLTSIKYAAAGAASKKDYSCEPSYFVTVEISASGIATVETDSNRQH